MNDPTVSIVIPVMNGERCIAECLKAVFSQSLAPSEVIVVDQESTDRTVELASRFPVKILHQPYGTVGGGRQFGLENARGEYVAFTDADCMPEKEWLENLIKGLHEETVGVGGGVRTVSHNFWERSIAIVMDTFLGSARSVRGRLFKKKRFVKHITGCNSLYRRDVLQSIGGFNVKLRMGEETELNRRLSKVGKLEYIPNATVFHDQGKGLRAFAKQTFAYGRGRGKLRLWDLQLIPPIAVPFLFLSLIFVNYLFLAFALLYSSLLLGVGVKFAARYRDIRYVISVPTVYFVEHSFYTLGFWTGLFEGLRLWI